MKMKILYKVTFTLALIVGLGACVNDLEVTPIDPNLATADKVLDSEEAFAQVLAKIYAGFAVSGQEGPAGDPDLVGFDEGHSQYWRGYFVCQELPTDEAINWWNDGDLPDVSELDWGANNGFIRQFYYRAIYQVSLANEFIRQANRLGKSEYTNLPTYIAEARFLRALSYWHALDLFGNGVPFVTENSAIGSDLPYPAGENARGPELFDYIESELLAICGETDDQSQVLVSVAESNVGQANVAAAWMVLSKLYLNHNIYRGELDNTYYQKAKTFLNKVNSAGYGLVTDADAVVGDVYTPYEYLFLADNHKANNEIIYTINFDGANSQTYGGMTYLISAAVGGTMDAKEDYGISGGWGGNRTTKALVNKFDLSDKRALWHTDGQELENGDNTSFEQGYAVSKYKNLTRTGGFASNEGNTGWVDVNAPVFRLADAYLMAAEVDLRLDGAVSGASQAFLQEIVDRAGTSLPGTIDLDWILDERARELYWECHRRTDLVRFGKFTKGYNWPLKGAAEQGKDVDDKYELMPIPFTDIIANPNLKQNPDY